MVEVDSKEEADDIDRQCFVFVVKTLQKIGVVDIICFILLVFLELWPSRQRAHQTFPYQAKEKLLREPQSIGSCSLFAIILGSRISRELIVHLCVCVVGKIPQKTFFGKSFSNLGGWGGWFSNKVQTLQKNQIAFLTRSYQWSIYGMCWITRGPPKSWHCKNCIPLSVGMASIYLMEFFFNNLRLQAQVERALRWRSQESQRWWEIPGILSGVELSPK